MISISISSDKATLQIMCKNENELLGDAAALVVAYQDLMQGQRQ